MVFLIGEGNLEDPMQSRVDSGGFDPDTGYEEPEENKMGDEERRTDL